MGAKRAPECVQREECTPPKLTRAERDDNHPADGLGQRGLAGLEVLALACFVFVAQDAG